MLCSCCEQSHRQILCSDLARLYPVRGLFRQRLHTVTWGVQWLCTPLQGNSPFSATDLHFFRMTMAPLKPVRYNLSKSSCQSPCQKGTRKSPPGGGGNGSSFILLPIISPPNGSSDMGAENAASSGLEKRVYSPRKFRSTSPVAPFRYLAMMIYDMPWRSLPISSCRM